MNIVFDKRPGRIMDLINSLKFIYNNSFQEFIDELGVESNRYVEGALKYLSEKSNFDWKYTDIFFSNDISVIDYLINSNDMWTIKDKSNLLSYLKNISHEDVKFKICEFLLSNSNFSVSGIEVILDSDKDLIKLIDSQSFSTESKWKLLNFMNNIALYIENLINQLDAYIKIFDKVMEQNYEIIEEFDDFIEMQIGMNGIEFLKEYTGNVFNFDNLPDIYLSTGFINCYSLQGSPKGDRANLFIGIEFSNVMKHLSGEGELEENLNIFKNLCDNSRFQILKLLLNEGLYAQELANKLEISMATVSYHMNFLLTSNLVLIEKQDGRKTYYNLNKKTLKSCIKFLQKTFEIDY